MGVLHANECHRQHLGEITSLAYAVDSVVFLPLGYVMDTYGRKVTTQQRRPALHAPRLVCYML